ncbi:MAG: DoxX family protein [Cytophagaceae bacterium]|nr:DoxX family protein [Cytophagaceae bacterium]
MIFKIISSALILFTVFMGVKHGWSALNPTPENMIMMQGLKISKTLIQLIGVLTLLGVLLILFPPAFFWGNVLNASLIVLMMGLFIRCDNWKGVWIEIPFLVIPLLLIYLKHPFAK